MRKIFLFISLLLLTSLIVILSNKKPSTVPLVNTVVAVTRTDSDVTSTITNKQFGFEITVPAKYKLSGDSSNFTLAYSGTDNRPTHFDMVQISFRLLDSEDKSVMEFARTEYENGQSAQGNKVDFNDIKQVSLNGTVGYSYSCPFLINRTCSYLPLKGNTNKVLLITSSYEDPNNNGYAKELKSIMDSFSYL